MASLAHLSRLVRKRRGLVAMSALLVCALALRAVSLGEHRFHEDEALYASWALLTVEDPALVSVPVDKPPLHPYLLAAVFRLLGRSELGFRLPNLYASVTSVALLYGLGKALYDRSTAIIAAALFSASPFAILFSRTAFVDPLLVLWVLLASWAAVARKPTLAGAALGLAYATKQQGALLALLVIALAVRERWGPARVTRIFSDTAARAAGALLLIIGAVTWWDSLRWHLQPSFWDRSVTTYGGLELVPLSAWAQRLTGWLELLALVFGSPVLNALLLAGLSLQLVGAVRRFRSDSQSRSDLLLSVYLIAYLVLHVVIGFRVWDRYLLPMVPVLCLLLARSILVLLRRAPRWLAWMRVSTGHTPARRLAFGLLAALLVRPACLGARSRLPVGSDHGAYEGIDRLAAYAQASLPPASTLYYHWLGWHYGYYLHGAPFDLVWYPDPPSLAQGAASNSGAIRAIAFPAWRDSVPMRQALSDRGLTLVPQAATYRRDGTRSFALYLITDGDLASTGGGDG